MHELRIKLLWVDKENHEKKLFADDDPTGDTGMIFIKATGLGLKDEKGEKATEVPLMNGSVPEYEKLMKILKVNQERFVASEKCRSLPVTIDSMAKIPFEAVLKCISACSDSGISRLLKKSA
jgi:hypothetical protein